MFSRKYLAIDIGNRYIKLVCGEARKDALIINEYDIIDTPPNTIRDGKIINLNALKDAINQSLLKYGIREKKLVVNITGTGVITRDIQVPRATDGEIEQMLEFEAQQYFPVDLENYVLDFKVIENTDNSEGIFSRVLLVAVPVKQVEEYMKLPGLLKKELAAIDLPVNCLSKFLSVWGVEAKDGSEAGSDKSKEFAVLDIGSETTGVSIFSGDKLRFSRILLNGSADIDKAVANIRNVDFAAGERIKIEEGSVFPEESNQSENELNITLESAIKMAVDNIIRDVNRFFDFYSSRSNANRIENIYLCGGGSMLRGMPEYLSSFFNIPVSYINFKKCVTYKGKRKQSEFEKDYVYLINVLGALQR